MLFNVVIFSLALLFKAEEPVIGMEFVNKVRTFEYKGSLIEIKFAATESFCINFWSLDHTRKINAVVKYAFTSSIISPLYDITGKNSVKLTPTQALPFALDFVNLTMCFVEVTEQLNNGRVYLEYIEKAWFKSAMRKTVEIAKFSLDPSRKVVERSRNKPLNGSTSVSQKNPLNILPLSSGGSMILYAVLYTFMGLVIVANIIGAVMYFRSSRKVTPIIEDPKAEVEA